MKKTLCIIFVTMIFVLCLTGCSNNTTEETVLEATVMSCEKGTFHEDSSFSGIANMHLVNGDLLNYTMYSTLADTNGYYDYDITVEVEGKYKIIVRDTPYEIGSKIYVEKIMTYNESKELIDVDYR